MKKILLVMTAILLICTLSACGTIHELMAFSEQNKESAFIEGQLLIEIIDVGQGDSILVITPEGKSMLIDSGEADAFNAVCQAIDNCGISRLDWIIATHPHSDHIGCMDKIVDDYDVGQIYMPDISHASQTYENLLNSISKKGLEIYEACEGVQIDMGSGVMCSMFSPVSGKEYASLNDYSPIMKITYGDTSFLTTGDAEASNEEDAMTYMQDLRATILKLGHHGSDTSTSEAFLTAVSPKYAVVSVGAGNSYGHPHKAVVDLLEKHQIPLMQTQNEGSILIYSDGAEIRINDIRIEETDMSEREKPAENANVVYKTKSGKAYHNAGCSYLNESAEPITMDEALELGLGACSRCAA